MKKLLPFLFLSLSLLSKAQAPDWLWSRSGGGLSNERVSKMASDKNGNLFLTGTYESSPANFGGVSLAHAPTTSWDSTDVYLVKYDSSGNVLWGRSGNGNNGDWPDAICTDTSGNVIVSGWSTSDTITFSGTSLPGPLPFSGSVIFLTKYDATGNLLWAKTYTNGFSCSGSALCTDKAGNIYMSGYFDSDSITFDGLTLYSSGYNSVFIVKFDPLGNPVWGRNSSGNTSGGFNIPVAIDVDTAGNVISTGYFQGAVIHFGTDSLIGTGGTYPDDIYLVKYDASGNYLWCRSAGGTSVDQPSGLATDVSGNILLSGFFGSSSLVFGGYTMSSVPADNADFFLVKYDPAGTVLWAKQGAGIQDDYAMGVEVAANSDIYISGFFSSPELALGPDTMTTIGIGGYVAKFDPSGNRIWIRENRMDNYVLTMTLDKTGHVSIAGILGGPKMTLGSDTVYNSDATPFTYTDDIFISRLGLENYVYPGDADRSMVVDNTDLLPIGLFYGQTGAPRAMVSNSWQPYGCSDWAGTETNGENLKHVDCNGDGIIDDNDTLAINMNYNSDHTISPDASETRAVAADMYFVVPGTVAPGQMVDAEIWIGNSVTPVSSLYGIAFEISYYSWLVQSGSELLAYPSSWLGSPGTNAISIGKAEASAMLMHGAETRTDHVNATGYGKIADFIFQVSNTITPGDSIVLNFPAYVANDASGNPVYFNTLPATISITVGIDELNDPHFISVFPNPASDFITVDLSSVSDEPTKLILSDITGRQILSQTLGKNAGSVRIDLSELSAGTYFVFAGKSRGIFVKD